MTVDLKQDTLTGIHAVYQDGPYDPGLLGPYLVSLENTWCACLATARHRTRLLDPTGLLASDLTYPLVAAFAGAWGAVIHLLDVDGASCLSR